MSNEITNLLGEAIPWMVVFFIANMTLSALLAGELSRYSLRIGAWWRHFILVPLSLVVVCAPIALLVSSFADKAGGQWVAILIFMPAFGSVFLVFAITFKANPRTARDNVDICHAWTSWVDGEKLKKKAGAIRLAALHQTNSEIAIVTAAQAYIAVMCQIGDHLDLLDEDSAEYQYLMFSGIFSVAAPGLLMWVVMRVSDRRNSHRKLITICLSGMLFKNTMPSGHGEGFHLARWRNVKHQHLFTVADALEKCLPRIRGRYAKIQYDEISRLYSALSLEIRSEATRIRKHDGRVDVLLSAATTLAMNDDLVATCKRLPKVLTIEIEQVEHARSSRMSRFLLMIDDALARHSRVIVAIAVITILIYYLSTGQMDKLIGFLQAKVGG